jgi:hypothetical protein
MSSNANERAAENAMSAAPKHYNNHVLSDCPQHTI